MKPSVLSLREKKMPTKDINIVKRMLDLETSPVLSAEQKARLDAVATMPDEEIDYTDAPSLPDAVWTNTVNLNPAKQQITGMCQSN